MSLSSKKNNFWIGSILVIFGLLTIISGGTALFTEVGHTLRGDIVSLVLWFNFIAGFFYLLAGILAYKLNPCLKKLSIIIALANILILTYLVIFIFQGGAYETRTIFAMSFRTFFWIWMSFFF